MESCANDLGVTFKLCQYVCILPGGSYDVPATFEAHSEKVCAVEAVSEMEVLGTVFDAIKKKIKMKDSFRCRATDVLGAELTSLTPLSLWRIAGVCFYTAYALGICLAHFRGPIRLLGRVARGLGGAPKGDAAWTAHVPVSSSELNDLRKMIALIATFPTTSFHPHIEPQRALFTDASDWGLGAVLVSHGTVTIASRAWEGFEASLPIDSREVLAAHFGVMLYFAPGSDEAPLLAVDNTAAYFAFVNGRSSEPCANEAVLAVRTHCSLSLIWIPTELMPADGPSRNETDDQLLRKIEAVQATAERVIFLPCLF